MSALAERNRVPASAESRSSAAWQPWRRITVDTDIAALESEWRALEAQALVTPYQAYGWVSAFAATVGKAHGMDFRYVALRDDEDRPVAILPLVITRRLGVRFAEFIGGKHANYHMGLFAPGFAAALDGQAAEAMLHEVGAAIGGLDALVFVNQPVRWGDASNPLVLLASGPSPSGAYKLALVPGDAEGTLKRSMSSHARKKLKNKRNRFAGFGASALVRARSEIEIERITEAFFSQKAARFAAMGIPDPFAEPAMRAFLREGAQGAAPTLELYSLDVAGRSVATYVGAVQGGRFSGMATSFAMDEDIAKTSPGEILLVDLIALKCREGFLAFDLGVGEARYKTTICDDRDDLVDTFLPLTAKGRLFVGFSRLKREAKRLVKGSPTALKLAQRASGLMKRQRAVEE
ncbi:GNAT family N-acetyltransferase [Bosea sp. PAMC 26642]|uniref:GNAT family N-acetyltransferase n=1 Tax=Bosea sp. (strain PAMC 26642) TaxID=1792307 RepID=UPI00076FF547|nr:GNAT family N-acetyltransferase [Bosea sp. PAMC 26642]AMJ59561.1 hypothetical protein AXW83_03905 [Bosea sp. PAMC 26642]